MRPLLLEHPLVQMPVGHKPVFRQFLAGLDSLDFQRGELPLSLKKPPDKPPFAFITRNTASL